MKNVHLSINYGGEERFDFVRKTVIVSVPYFTTVRIYNFGPDENARRFDELVRKYPNFSVVNLGKHHFGAITEDLLIHHYMTLPNGDWSISIDSDWRLPKFFMENIQNEIEICEKEGYNCMYSYQIAHTLIKEIYPSSNGELNFDYTQDYIDKFIKTREQNPECYGWPLLQKVDKENVMVNSFLGNHCCHYPLPYKCRKSFGMLHMHFRHFDEYAFDSTKLFYSWWYPAYNPEVNAVQQQLDAQDSWEAKEVQKFKLKYNCFTSNQLRELLKSNLEGRTELKQLSLSFKDSKMISYVEMYRLASNHNMEPWTTPLEQPCNGICCLYNEGRIFDI